MRDWTGAAYELAQDHRIHSVGDIGISPDRLLFFPTIPDSKQDFQEQRGT
jgi:hypothetical protein